MELALRLYAASEEASTLAWCVYAASALGALATLPWMGLAPGLPPVLLAGRLAGFVPHPWGGKHRRLLALLLLSPVLLPGPSSTSTTILDFSPSSFPDSE